MGSTPAAGPIVIEPMPDDVDRSLGTSPCLDLARHLTATYQAVDNHPMLWMTPRTAVE